MSMQLLAISNASLLKAVTWAVIDSNTCSGVGAMGASGDWSVIVKRVGRRWVAIDCLIRGRGKPVLG